MSTVNGTKVVGFSLGIKINRDGSNTPCKVKVIGVAATHPTHNGLANKCGAYHTW